MKYLKKINKGLALTVLILLILVIYLISIEAGRNKDKPEIERTCKEYIDLVNKYAVTPENITTVYSTDGLSESEKTAKITEAKNAINAKMEEFENKLKEKMIQNELSIRMQKEMVENFAENSSNIFSSILTKYDKEITKITKFSFDEDQVTVTFNAKVDTETKHLDLADGNKEVSKKDTITTNEESITLQKIDGTWKVVYADLQYNLNNESPMGVYTTMVY